MMYLWVSKAMGDGIILTGKVLHQKWNHFTDLVGVPEDERLHLSNGWLDHFKARHGLKDIKQHGEAALVSADTIEKERKRIQELIKKYGYELRNIFNIDKMDLFYMYILISFVYMLQMALLHCYGCILHCYRCIACCYA